MQEGSSSAVLAASSQVREKWCSDGAELERIQIAASHPKHLRKEGSGRRQERGEDGARGTTGRDLQNPKLSNYEKRKKGSVAFHRPPLPATATSGAQNSRSLREAGRGGGAGGGWGSTGASAPSPFLPCRACAPRSWNEFCKRQASSLPHTSARTEIFLHVHTAAHAHKYTRIFREGKERGWVAEEKSANCLPSLLSNSLCKGLNPWTHARSPMQRLPICTLLGKAPIASPQKPENNKTSCLQIILIFSFASLSRLLPLAR